MKGIILSAGRGTRLYPMTLPICKPLLPVYDKPMIYYPLAVLMQSKIKDILIIIPPFEEEAFYRLLGDGSKWGVNISYKIQDVPRGIADAFIIGKDFIGNDCVCLVLGDNIFYSEDINKILIQTSQSIKTGATVFGYYVENPCAFGVVQFDENGNALSIEEKPKFPKSNYIIPGIYFYDNQVIEIAKNLKPSLRGELEITDVNIEYLKRKQLHVKKLENNFTWLDAGTADNLLSSSQTIKDIQNKTKKYVACLEEIAYNNKYISKSDVQKLAKELNQTLYGNYLMKL